MAYFKLLLGVLAMLVLLQAVVAVPVAEPVAEADPAADPNCRRTRGGFCNYGVYGGK